MMFKSTTTTTIKLIISTILILLLNCSILINSKYVHLQIFGDNDGQCSQLILGDFTSENVCVDSTKIVCSDNLSSITAYKYNTSDCAESGLIGNETLPTGVCSGTFIAYCTQEIDMPQDRNYIVNVRHNVTENECVDYKQGIVGFNYVPTGICTSNIANSKFSTSQTCDENSWTQTNFKGPGCNKNKQDGKPSVIPLPINECTNTTDALSTYSFCYIPNF